MNITIYDIRHAYDVFNNVIMYYVIAISIAFVVLSILASYAMNKYKRRNGFVDYRAILSTELAPGISIIAPAYNEGNNIVENVRSLLSLHYPDYEIIIVNDGSKDDTLEKLIEAYDLYKVHFAINYQIETKDVRAVYKSKNKAYSDIVVVDKENGGKADALNVGLNISREPLVACIDVDCILAHDALLKLVKPFMEGDRKIIATGGVIRAANSCEIQAGEIKKVRLPTKYKVRVQVLEYFRAFLMGRMAWAQIDGLLLISGAFGMFDKEVAIRAGGYDPKTVGEDMELVVRMRRLMHDEKTKYRVAFIPDPLCWTEVPETWKMLGKQRNRWARGTIETLWKHRRLCLNPKYGVMGMVSIPFWILFEWLAPLIELTGIILYTIMAVFGWTNWTYYISFFILVYCFSVMFTVFAIWFEEETYQQYRKPKYIVILLFTTILEPFVYHPFVMLSSVKGNIDWLRGKKSWGEMTRVGFNSNKKKEATPSTPTD